MKMYDFKECKAIAFDFRLKTEMFLITELLSIPKVGRDTTFTNLGDRDRPQNGCLNLNPTFLAIYLNISGLIRAVLPIWQICLKL